MSVVCVRKGPSVRTIVPGHSYQGAPQKEEEQLAELLSSQTIMYQREVRIDYRCMVLDFVMELVHQRVILEGGNC